MSLQKFKMPRLLDKQEAKEEVVVEKPTKVEIIGTKKAK
jgi:hypothetical protein